MPWDASGRYLVLRHTDGTLFVFDKEDLQWANRIGLWGFNADALRWQHYPCNGAAPAFLKTNFSNGSGISDTLLGTACNQINTASKVHRLSLCLNRSPIYVYERKVDNHVFLFFGEIFQNFYDATDKKLGSFSSGLGEKELRSWYTKIEPASELINEYQYQFEIEDRRLKRERREHEENQRKEREKRILLQRKLNEQLTRFGIEYFYHMTRIENLPGILENGILSRRLLSAKNNNFEDIAIPTAIEHRDKPEPIFNKNILAYTPTYFNPNNAMLYLRKDIQANIIILAISQRVLVDNKYIFTDGNAAANATKFFGDIEHLDKLDWSCLRAKWWTDFEDGKRTRCAELLVPDAISPKLIKKILCPNTNSEQIAKKHLQDKKIEDIKVEVSKQFFFL